MHEHPVTSKQFFRDDCDDDESDSSLDSLIDNFELTPRTPTVCRLQSVNVLAKRSFSNTCNNSQFNCFGEDGCEEEDDDDESLDNLFEHFGHYDSRRTNGYGYEDICSDIAILSHGLIRTDI